MTRSRPTPPAAKTTPKPAGKSARPAPDPRGAKGAAPQGRIMLATPARMDPEALVPALRAALATGLVGCVRMDMPGASETDIRRAADILRPVCHEADVALVLAEHFRLVAQLGLDGTEVAGRGVRLRDVRAAIGPDAIMGVACGASRHDGMSAAEAGADYVLFRPFKLEGSLGDGTEADLDLFEWWAEMIETPVVAEGGIGAMEMHALAACADFVIPAAGVWDRDIAAEIIALNAIMDEEEAEDDEADEG